MGLAPLGLAVGSRIIRRGKGCASGSCLAALAFPAVLLASHRCATAPIPMEISCSPHPYGVLHAVNQHIERYLRLEGPSSVAYRFEPPLTEEEITLLEEEVLPVIATFLERSEAAAKEAERAELERWIQAA